jgi:hypothetical protein
MSSRYEASSNEAAMLDDIEATSARIYEHTRRMKGEVDYHNGLVGDISDGLDSSAERLQQEAAYVSRISKAAEKGVCWMYGVIAIEVLMLFFLVYNGI